MCAHLDLAHCLFKVRKLKQAEEQLRAAIACNPTHREGIVRLARLKMWTGHAAEAASIIRGALQNIPLDVELGALFLSAALGCGERNLIEEASALSNQFQVQGERYARLETARAQYLLWCDETDTGREELSRLAALERGPFEAVVAFAELLMSEKKTSYARHHLHRALAAAPEHPRVLTLLSRTYLEPAGSYEPDFAVQLALKACQNSEWLNLQAMHDLAEAYYHLGDKMSALLVASRAKSLGDQSPGTFRHSKNLEDLIESLSSGTQA
jgi:predicted Zn-dependent protease